MTSEFLTFNKTLLLWYFVTSFIVWSKTLKIETSVVSYFTQFKEAGQIELVIFLINDFILNIWKYIFHTLILQNWNG